MALNPGDIAIVQYNADGTDNFAFVALVAIPAGEQILFTDNGWLAAGGLRSGEGTITWTAPVGGIAAGTVVTLDTTPAASAGSVSETGDLNFSGSGDQIIAYQDDAGSLTPIFALNNDGASVFQADATSSNTSALPAGLTLGTNAVAIAEIDNARYTGATTGTKAALLTAIADPANWSGDDAVNQTGPASFTVSGGGTGPVLSVSITPGSISEDGGTASGTVSRTGDTSAALVVTLGSDDTSEATVPASVTILAGETSAPFTVTAVDDAVQDGAQSVTVTASAAGFADATGGLSVTDDEVTITRIHSIQGTPATQVSGASPLEGQSVTVQGVVTGVYPLLNGFFVQEEDVDADADLLTSEGIFVFLGSAPTVAEGDLVTVTGAVDENFGMTQIDNDNGDLSVSVASSGNALPTARAIDRSAFGANTNAAALEEVEGMLVRFEETLSVSEYFQLARFGEVVLYEGGRPYQFTQLNAPSVAGNAAYLADLATRKVILDDDNNTQNEPITTTTNGTYFHPAPNGFGTGAQGTDYFRGGDAVADLTGIMEWSFGNWRVRPTEAAPIAFTPVNTRAANAAPEDVGGSLKVASFNVLNYFATIDTTSSNSSGTAGPSGMLDARGADSAAELDRQTDKLVEALSIIGADVFGLVEIENDTGASAQALVDALNAEVGAGTYSYIDTGFIGTDAIKVAFLYNTVTVTPVGDFAILDSTVDARFLDTANRPVLAQTFEQIANGESFTAAVNHFKSKGSVTGSDADTGDGQGNNPTVRADAAAALVDWLATDPTGSGDPDFLILGDLNAYAMEDAITAVRAGADDTAGTTDDFTDLAQAFNGTSAYSYLFDGQLGTLDYALANQPLLAQVTGVTEWHINADEVPLFDYNDDVRDTGEASFEEESDANPLFEANAFRTSDHDPIIVGLNLGAGSGPNVVTGTAGRDNLVGTAGDDLFRGMGGTDVITTGAGADVIDFADTYDNGRRDHTIVRDFDPDNDILGGLSSADVARSLVSGLRTTLILDDRDIVTLYGVTDPDTIEFGNDLIS